MGFLLSMWIQAAHGRCFDTKRYRSENYTNVNKKILTMEKTRKLHAIKTRCCLETRESDGRGVIC